MDEMLDLAPFGALTRVRKHRRMAPFTSFDWREYFSNRHPDSSFYKWVWKNGKEFGKLAIHPTAKEIKEFRYATKAKECYYNAQMTANYSGGKIAYYEGWYITEFCVGLESARMQDIPLVHGFNVYKGKVFDPTAWKKFGVNSYFGVKIPLKFVNENMAKTGMAQAILHKYYYYRSVRK